MSVTEIVDTWSSRERPILMACLRRIDSGQSFPMLEAIRAELGMDVTTMRLGLDALRNANPPYIDVAYTMAGAERVGGHLNSVTERARRELGSWPSAQSIVDEISDALDLAAEAEPEPERKGKLRAAAAAIGGVAKEIAVEVIAKKIDS